DGKTYTFHLRKGVKFHDGTPLTAADVVETWLRMVTVRKGLQSPRAALFVNVGKVEAPDDYTVRITLKAPQGGFMLLAAIPWGIVYPKAYLDKYGDMKKYVMGSGPFKLVEYVRGVSITAVRNPDYFIKDLPYLDGINRYIIRDEGAKSAAFRSGQIELMAGLQHNISPEERAVIAKERPGVQIQKAQGSTFHVLHPNFMKKPWNDKRVVQAVNLVLDKQVFIDVALFGDAVVGGFMFPDGVWGTPPDELRKLPGYRRPTAEDIAQAKKLLAEAGYANGFKFLVDTRTLVDYQKRAVLVNDMVKKIGLEAAIDVREDATFYSKRDAGDFDFTVGGVVSPMPDPDQYLAYAYLTDSGSNYGKYSNKTLDDLFVQQSRAMDPKERQKLLLQMEKILMDELPVIPNYWRVYVALVGPRVRNYVFTGIYNGQKLEDIWLAQ
ncbi:MAG: ABC transporter substrate-binding protein, partial [Chloroflexota bacterium]|nr:ABC transporter substrate-binding protein [Chloroflexota bacterium]